MSAIQQQFCTFQLDELLFGVESQRVQEVIRLVDLSPVPLAPAMVGGLMNLRGQIVAALDLRTRLGLAARPEGKKPMCVVVRTTEEVVGLLVDDIGDVLDVADGSFERPPETLPAHLRAVLRGVHKLDQRLLLVLGVEQVCMLEEGRFEAGADQPAAQEAAAWR